jgi:hypothetical protein
LSDNLKNETSERARGASGGASFTREEKKSGNLLDLFVTSINR